MLAFPAIVLSRLLLLVILGVNKTVLRVQPCHIVHHVPTMQQSRTEGQQHESRTDARRPLEAGVASWQKCSCRAKKVLISMDQVFTARSPLSALGMNW